MTNENQVKRYVLWNRIILLVIFCIGFSGVLTISSARKKTKQDSRVYLIHADELRYNAYGAYPPAQIVKGRVSFRHQGATLTCDSAYFYQDLNSVKAFGHVHYRQGDTLSLDCDHGDYDGQEQMMRARKNVVLKHRRQTLYTDSLDYDRLYSNAYFFEGGRLIDGNDRLSSDWGEYNTELRQAVFYYNVRLTNGQRLITTDTLYYDTNSSTAHVTGPSKITQGKSTIDTDDGFFNTKTDQAQMYGRSTIVNDQKTITGDSLYYDDKTGQSEGFGNVIYVDNLNKNELQCGHLTYNEKTGYGFATIDALVKDYSQKDTLYMHSDSMKVFTFNINTDSVYRKVHCYNKVRAYRTDVQAVCDSLVFNSLDSCMTMYQDPIVWNLGRQLLGEEIRVYMNDSTVRMTHVIGQALSIEKVDEDQHFNQISSKEMQAYFENGVIRNAISIGNVCTVYYPIEEKDTSIIVMNYTETDTLKMFFSQQRKLEKIWMPAATGTWYPLTQIPPEKLLLPQFVWFEDIRPRDKDDVLEWRGKSEEEKLKVVERHTAPLKTIGGEQPISESIMQKQKALR